MDDNTDDDWDVLRDDFEEVALGEANMEDDL